MMLEDKNRKYILQELIKFFQFIGCDNPSNIDAIVDYIIDDAIETTNDPECFRNEGISNMEISIGFRRFIESC